jgi:nitroimidazol reductase NimA-like FMN-containing flavoprotein (pyridoxamine 5'-phosphate oxidase superfamily)
MQQVQLNIEKTIRQYIAELPHLSLATTVHDRPWVCEVHFAYDDELNIYFRSLPARRHSQEIAQNQFVAGNIVMQHAFGEKPRGVYFEGRAEVLEDLDETHPGYIALTSRLGVGPEIIAEAKKADGPKLYKITVSDYYLFDARESKPSQKYHLAWHS